LLIASDAGLLPNECGAKSGHSISSSLCLPSADSSPLFEMDTIDLLLSPFDSTYAAFLQDTSMPTHAMTKTTFRPALCGLLRCSLSLMDMNPNYGKGFLF